jgi:hypothetical protein
VLELPEGRWRAVLGGGLDKLDRRGHDTLDRRGHDTLDRRGHDKLDRRGLDKLDRQGTVRIADLLVDLPVALLVKED